MKRFNLEEIRKAIGVLFKDVKFGDGECIEVRVPGKKKHITAAGWFDNIEELAGQVAVLAQGGFGEGYRHIHENAYWTCNPCTDALLARQPKNTIAIAADTTSDNNITRRIWLPIDIDPIRASGVSATKEEKKLAGAVTSKLFTELQTIGVPVDSMAGGTSGNGYHILIRIDMPNDDDAKNLIKRCLAAMQGMVGTGKVEVDPKVFNAARIIKCYGTLSCKGEDTLDRPWMWSKLTEVPETVVVCPTEMLEKIAALAPDRNPRRDTGEKREGPWTEESTQTYLDWTGWECVDPVNYNNGRKWNGVCIDDSNHKDAAVILTDGWWSYTCYHSSCKGVKKTDEFKKHWEEENGERYDYPNAKQIEESDTFEFEDACEVPVVRPKVKVKVVLKPGVATAADVVAEALVAPAAPAIQLQAWNLTDTGNAERFVARFGHVFRYCPQHGWYFWDDTRWKPNSVGRATRAATIVARKVVNELSLHLTGVTDPELAKAIEAGVKGWAKKSESQKGIGSTVGLGQWQKSIEAHISEFDRNLWAFNCANGTIDLSSGAFQPHAQSDMCTKVSPVSYDESATCPLWLSFLDDIAAGDQELIGYLQRAVGYTLTGSTDAHCLFLLHGAGRNGKSTFIETVAYLMGDYFTSAHMSTFLVRKGDTIPNDLAALTSARMVAAVETDDSRKLDEPKIKQITGGDTITARYLHKEFFNFRPQFKIWLATNALPVIKGTDEGIWRRMKRVPFKVYIPDGKMDEKLGVKLKSEASGILNWALEGLSDYLVNGLDEPECVTKATTEYRDNQDWLERFVREECEMDIKEFIGARKLYDRFCQWADRTGEYCVKEVKFAEAMTTHGYQKARPTVGGKRLSGVAYMGMKLKDSFGDMGMGMNTLQNVDEL